MSNLLSDESCRRLLTFKRIYVGLSGGVDSVVLLHQILRLSDLKTRCTAIHINHQLHSLADQWQDFCEQLCLQWQIPYISKKINIHANANIEAEAREKRYAVIQPLLSHQDVFVTAHHADDQVETFFLNLFRGAGINGLACMPSIQSFGSGQLYRPMLDIPADALIAYAQKYRLVWVDDPSNQDCRFQRNWLRHQWLPILKERLPGAANNILRSIGHIQNTFEQTQFVSENQLDACLEDANVLRLDSLNRLPDKEQAWVIRAWLKKNHVKMPSTQQLQQLFLNVIEAKQDASPEWRLANQVVRRFNRRLYLLDWKSDYCQPDARNWLNFPLAITLTDCHLTLEARVKTNLASYERVDIRFRQGGERIRHKGKNRCVKKLLQQWQIPPWERDQLPLIYIDDQLAMIADLAVSDKWEPVLRLIISGPHSKG